MDASDPKVIKPLVAWECREPDRNGGRTTCAYRESHSAVFTNVTLLHRQGCGSQDSRPSLPTGTGLTLATTSDKRWPIVL
jgi:hypothetical protein